MSRQIFNILFSILLLPINFCCAFWLFREAIHLTGMTFRAFLETTSTAVASLHVGSHQLKKRQQFFVRFFQEKSADPQKSVRFLWMFGICTLPGLAALLLAVYAARQTERLSYAFVGNLLLLAINIALFIWGKIYRNTHSLTAVTAEKLHERHIQKPEDRGKKRAKSIPIYALVGAFLLGILFFFIVGIAGISPAEQTKASVYTELTARLTEKGYETANVPTTYWQIDENKLLQVVAGVKGDSKLEFYGYADDETVDLVYNQMVYLTAPLLDAAERESHETALPDGNSLFTIGIDGVYYLVLVQDDTVIYAYAPDSLDEIYEILTGIGYWNSKA